MGHFGSRAATRTCMTLFNRAQETRYFYHLKLDATSDAFQNLVQFLANIRD
jgi:hypothetical protein